MKIYTVKAARKAATCARCQQPIKVGQGYIWWQFYGDRKETKRCLRCPRPRLSELTGSDKKARLYAAQEMIEDAISSADSTPDTIDEFDMSALGQVLRDAAEQVREVGEEYRQSAENIEEHFQGSSTADDCNTWADECESWADALEQGADAVDAVTPDEPDKPEAPLYEMLSRWQRTSAGDVVVTYAAIWFAGYPDMLADYAQSLEEYADNVQSALEEAVQEAISEAQNALDSDKPSCI